MNDSLTIVFLIASSQLKDGERNYQKMIDAYKEACGGAFPGIPLAYIKLPEKETALLPDIIDYLYDNDIKPVVATEGFEARVFPQLERTKDVFKIFSMPSLLQSTYTLFVDGPFRIKTDQLFNHLSSSVSMLTLNPLILSVAFDSSVLKIAGGEQFIVCPSLTSRPIVTRTRDLMIASKLAVDNAAQLQSISSEQAISNMMRLFSAHPYRFLAFNPQTVYSFTPYEPVPDQ